MKLFPTVRSVLFHAFVICLMLLLSSDAFAFGKNGKGLFGWREGKSGSSCGASCGTSCGGATGQACATSCANGQCGPNTSATATQSPDGIVCVDGKCYTQEQFLKKFGATSAGPSFPTTAKPGDKITFENTAANAWSPPAWKQVK